MKDLLSPREVANALAVSESSVKRWCDQGLIESVRTVGGHRRVPLRAVLSFVRQSGKPLVHPESFGVRQLAGDERRGRATSDLVRSCLESGDVERLRAAGLSRYARGTTCLELCDDYLAPAFLYLGDQWERGALEVYQERRAVGVCLALLHDFESWIPQAPEGSPVAVGGTLSGDPYSLPTGMIEVVLRESGWNATSLGTQLPVETLCEAVCREKPRLFWLSVSSVESDEEFIRQYSQLHKTATERGVALAVGGRALTETLRRRIQYSAYCDKLSHLVAFAAVLHPHAA